MKKFLEKQEGVETKKQLQRGIDRFGSYYNEVRPYRGMAAAPRPRSMRPRRRRHPRGRW